MKYVFLTLITLFAFQLNGQEAIQADAEATPSINWMTWEEAFEANKKNPKKIFIDVYTDWCGWCKKMDKTTFLNDDVVKTLNRDFYAIKFDAEQKDDINFNGHVFKFVNQGRKGSHQLAYALLEGRMGYPAFVMLDESFNRVMISPGYQKVQQLIPQLDYTSTNSYKEMNFQDFKM